MLVNHCIPPKPDHPETDSYLGLAKVLLKYRPSLIFESTEEKMETALFAAACQGSKPHVEYFIGLGADIEAQNDKGNTPLWIASFKRYPCIMDVLLQKGANVNHLNIKGNAPLYGVCCRGPIKIAEQLLRRGANVDQVLPTGDTHILICCRNGRADVLQLLLTYVDEDFVDYKAPIDGFNAIMSSAEQDQPDCIRVLQAYGTKLDQVTSDDNTILPRATPLHIAAYYGRVWAAQALLELGADPNKQDLHGCTPMHIAVIQGSTALVKVLRSHADLKIQNHAGYTSIAYARNNVEIRPLLVNPLLDPLMELAQGGYSPEEEKLALGILMGCQIPGVVVPGDVLNVCDLSGMSVFAHLIVNGKRELVETMLDLGVARDEDPSGVCTLTWAWFTRNSRIIKAVEKRIQGKRASDKQIANIRKEMTKSDSADLLFLGQLPAYTQASPNTIMERMALFVNAPFSVDTLREQFALDLPKLTPGQTNVEKCFDEKDMQTMLRTRLLWDSIISAVRCIALGTSLTASELVALSMYTNNAVVPEVISTQLITRQFSSAKIKDYVSLLHGCLVKLLPFKGEVFLAAGDIDRKLFMKGKEFTWNRFVSASSLWRLALENIPSFTAKNSKGVVFLIKSKTGRAVLNSFDAEVIFLPNARFVVSNWYHGNVIALGQENIREHTFAIKEKDGTQRPCLKEMTESDKSLIIELTEVIA